jgi:hypothetical protein
MDKTTNDNRKRKQQPLSEFIKVSKKDPPAASGATRPASPAKSPAKKKDGDSFLDYFYPNKSPFIPIKDAFETLKDGSKALNNRAVFSLDIVDGKMLPVFEVASVSNAEQDESIKWSCEIKLNDFPRNWTNSTAFGAPVYDLQVHLVTNIASDPSLLASAASLTKSAISPSLLKSMLQKGVRRKLLTQVMAISKELFYHHLQEFFRRLPIICLEDVLLHPGYPILTWLMVAISKGYSPPLYICQICFLMIFDMTETEHRDLVPNILPQAIQLERNKYLQRLQVTQKQRKQLKKPYETAEQLEDIWRCLETKNNGINTILASILVRSCYGGMDGDMVMLKQYAELWWYRFQGQPTYSSSSEQSTIVPSSVSSATTAGEGAGVGIGGNGSVISGISSISGEFSHPLPRRPPAIPSVPPTTTAVSTLKSSSSRCYLHEQYLKQLQSAYEDDGVNKANNADADTLPWFQSLANGDSQASTLRTDQDAVNWGHALLDAFNCTPTLSIPTMQVISPTTGKTLKVTLPSWLSTLFANLHLSIHGFHAMRTLSWNEIIPEGIDFHCDPQIIPFVLSRIPKGTLISMVSTSHGGGGGGHDYSNTINTLASELIKSTIWMFRSSTNTHKLWSEVLSEKEVELYSEFVKEQCTQKKCLAIVWKYICNLLREYSQQKLTQILKR